MTSVIRLHMSKLNFSTSNNFITGIISNYYSVPNISISVNFTLKRYNAVIYNPVMNNY